MNQKRLANGVSAVSTNGKTAVINGLRRFKNPLSWLVIFLVVPFNKTSLFYKTLITFIIYFILLFVRVFPEPVINKVVF